MMRWTVLFMAMFLVVAVVPAPQAQAAQATLTICADVESGRPVGCGAPVKQGWPWITVAVNPPGATLGRRLLLADEAGQTDCVGGPFRVPIQMWTCRASLGGGWRPGPYVVRLEDVPSGAVVAEKRFGVAPQSPEEAMAEFAGPSPRDVIGRAIAQARLGRVDDALREIDVAEGRYPEVWFTSGFEDWRAALLAMAGRWAEAERVQLREIRLHEAHERELGPVSAGEHYWAAAYAARACDMDVAEREAAMAVQLAPHDPYAQQLIVRIEQERGDCAAQSGR